MPRLKLQRVCFGMERLDHYFEGLIEAQPALGQVNVAATVASVWWPLFSRVDCLLRGKADITLAENISVSKSHSSTSWIRFI